MAFASQLMKGIQTTHHHKHWNLFILSVSIINILPFECCSQFTHANAFICEKSPLKRQSKKLKYKFANKILVYHFCMQSMNVWVKFHIDDAINLANVFKSGDKINEIYSPHRKKWGLRTYSTVWYEFWFIHIFDGCCCIFIPITGIALSLHHIRPIFHSHRWYFETFNGRHFDNYKISQTNIEIDFGANKNPFNRLKYLVSLAKYANIFHQGMKKIRKKTIKHALTVCEWGIIWPKYWNIMHLHVILSIIV